MKKYMFLALAFSGLLPLNAQEKPKDAKELANSILVKLSDDVCKCIDSIPTADRRRKTIASDIGRCIDESAGAYQIGAKLMAVDLGDDKASADVVKKKEVNISLDLDKNSAEYQTYYFEMERYLMENCPAMKNKIAVNDRLTEKSLSSNEKAMQLYSQGFEETKKENYQGAIDNYKKAVKLDPKFAFAYDNMGICYRRLNDYDKAIESYKKSLQIDPNGTMPLQNIAVAYQYKKDYPNAIQAYKKLAELDSNDPEIFYGIGQIYSLHLNDLEKGLDNLCKAYNIYVAQKSPYRTDAETLIQTVYAKMKQEGKEAKFDEILANNNLSPNKK